ncbi:hypothetical protein PROFUN_00178 [Planoprotostelium fungivorum]|uniref:Uncharacterized protein n=1 Tax=Planoprotostelium fungivorum TaxID=1890364 RepID=A0A2P6P0U8_9EUKA|nr:hypothetical protein PROFUN_00178 [Planoprotostelium fungivorum]
MPSRENCAPTLEDALGFTVTSYSFQLLYPINNTQTMKVLLLTLGLAVCLVSAGSFAAEGPAGAVAYKSNEASRLLAIASILRGGEDDADDRGLLSDINIIGNFIGGKKNRIDAINDFGGDFSGFGNKRNFLSGAFGQSDDDFVFDLVQSILARSNRAGSLKRSSGSADPLSILRDLNVIGNFIGGKENRIDAINGYKGIGSGAF